MNDTISDMASQDRSQCAGTPASLLPMHTHMPDIEGRSRVSLGDIRATYAHRMSHRVLSFLDPDEGDLTTSLVVVVNRLHLMQKFHA